ncbi:MAG TPA: BON domain-containing protein [Candidatus Koribacter sp.]
MKILLAVTAAFILTTAAWCQITVDPVIPDVQIVPGPASDKNEIRIAQGVRHELLMLEHYTIFDDLGFTVRGSHVTLTGAVTNDDLVKWATDAAKRVEGVEQVTNKIEGLSPLQDDRRIRFEASRHLFAGALAHYGNVASPWIHIIVKGGYIHLVGYVTNATDKNLATTAVSQVPGVFGVKNDLQIVSDKTAKPEK